MEQNMRFGLILGRLAILKETNWANYEQLFMILLLGSYYKTSTYKCYRPVFHNIMYNRKSNTVCGSHFENHTNFKILKEPLLVQK